MIHKYDSVPVNVENVKLICLDDCDFMMKINTPDSISIVAKWLYPGGENILELFEEGNNTKIIYRMTAD